MTRQTRVNSVDRAARKNTRLVEMSVLGMYIEVGTNARFSFQS